MDKDEKSNDGWTAIEDGMPKGDEDIWIIDGDGDNDDNVVRRGWYNKFEKRWLNDDYDGSDGTVTNVIAWKYVKRPGVPDRFKRNKGSER